MQQFSNNLVHLDYISGISRYTIWISQIVYLDKPDKLSGTSKYHIWQNKIQYLALSDVVSGTSKLYGWQSMDHITGQTTFNIQMKRKEA